MTPPRRSIQIHTMLFCVSTLFSLMVINLGLAAKPQLFPAVLIFFAFGEIALHIPAFYQLIDARRRV